MKATANKAIIYDDTCPLCVWYTGAFVKTGMLGENNRISFNELADKSEIAENMDLHRSKHEIPLVDLKGGETLYGLDSLVFILKQKLPIIGWLLQFRPIRAFFKILYNLVSFNRRVIVGAEKPEAMAYDCTPDFHAGYRLVYIVLAVLIAAFGAYSFGSSMVYWSHVPTVAYINLLVLWIGFFAWTIFSVFSLLTIFDNRSRIDYFGQLATILLMGFGVYALMMSLAALVPFYSLAIFSSALAIVVSFGVMCRAHFRRLKVVDLANWRIAVWVLCFVIGGVIVLSS